LPVIPTNHKEATAEIALVGSGPAALVAAIALARRGVRTAIFERDAHPERAPRFNPDRSYTIDISGHGLKALRHIDACAYFDERMIRFKGLKIPGGRTEEWSLPGWTGSRGDILRALMALVEDKYKEWISLNFECRVESVDVHTGALTLGAPSDRTTRRFDFIVGGDGAGSVVRKALREQVPGFAVETKSYSNYCTMIELDRVGDRMDENYLHGLSARPFCVAGAIKGDHGSDTPRWFCAVGTKAKQAFSSTEEARRFFRLRIPRVLELTSEEKIAAFAQRTCYHIGQTLTCSRLHGGKAVLLGDAAAAFPPIGQGVNAAMESAMALDLCIGEAGGSPAQLLEAAGLYDRRWKPEADAVSWMSVRSLFENRFHMLRAAATSRLGLSIFAHAKRADIPFSEVRRRAERLWPLWV
jgi:2-polyprenyl-6-methoxyphenol hydroxylase-like FAD-dependent oxidoreductase